MAESISSKIEAVLAAAAVPLSLDEICSCVFGQITDRNRGAVRTAICRLDEIGLLIRHPRKYALKKTETAPGERS
jgi:hypothetical protein